MPVYEPAEVSRIARTAVVAVASDEMLVERLVLKGGNALQLIHQIGFRTSADLDFSMAGDVDPKALGQRLEKALIERFDAEGYVALDFTFESRPPDSEDKTWGGYNANIRVVPKKLIPELHERFKQRRMKKAAEKRLSTADRTGTGAKKLRKAAIRNARASLQPLSPEEAQDAIRPSSIPVHIEVSKYEYTEGKQRAELDGFECYVYSPAMISAEKFRAICQQHPDYKLRKHPASRARDFYDIHALATLKFKVDIGQHLALVREMFRVKEVSLSLLGRIGEMRELHRTSWPAVLQAITGERLTEADFDRYFDFVLGEAKKLESLWKADAPG